MAKRGRKKWVPTKEEIEKARAWAASGLTEEQIAASLGVSWMTLDARRKEILEFFEAIKAGKAQGVRIITNKLFDTAMAGNVASMIFYLKNRGGWADKQEIQGNPDKPIEVKKNGQYDKDYSASVLTILEECGVIKRETAPGDNPEAK